jgi:predicted Zn-dependent protease
LEEATRLDPDFAIAWAYLALVYCAFAQEDLALAPSERAYALRSRLNANHRLYVEYLHLLLLGDYEGAHQQLRTLIDFFPDDPNVNRHLAQSFAVTLKPEAGLPYARRSAELDPGNRLDQDMYVSALAESGQPEAANQALRKALAEAPGSGLLSATQAFLQLLNLDATTAVKTLDGVISREGPDWHYHLMLMKALLLGGQFARAQAEIESRIHRWEIERSESGLEAYRYWLGQVAAMQGDDAQAATQARQLSERDPIPPSLPALRMAAELAWVASRPDLLETIVDRIRQSQRTHQSTRSRGFVAFAEALEASTTGRQADALRRIDAALQYWPDATAHWVRGELLLEAGEDVRAFEAFRAASAAKAYALHFFAVTNWVRSLGRAAWCLEKLGKPEAALYRGPFEHLWGDPSRYRFARPV